MCTSVKMAGWQLADYEQHRDRVDRSSKEWIQYRQGIHLCRAPFVSKREHIARVSNHKTAPLDSY